jgi:hypothetical protein
MKISTHIGRPPFIITALFIGLTAAFLVGSLNINPAYASGSLKISTHQEALDIRFVSAETNDPGISRDPGQSKHVGRCTATASGKTITFKVYGGYPGYECVLSTKLKNMSKQAVRFRRLEFRTSSALLLTPPVLPPGFILQPKQEVTLSIRLQIKPTAEENSQYKFTARLIMEALPR